MVVLRRANCCVANAFSARLWLIWPKSRLKTTKMSKKLIFGKNFGTQWVNQIHFFFFHVLLLLMTFKAEVTFIKCWAPRKLTGCEDQFAPLSRTWLDIFASACADIKILRFWMRKWPTSLDFLSFLIFFRFPFSIFLPSYSSDWASTGLASSSQIFEKASLWQAIFTTE